MTKLNYDTLKSLPDNLSLGAMLSFLAKIKNTRLRPARLDSNCPPVFFWWFDEKNTVAEQFIKDVFDSFFWKNKWIIASKSNGKWLLFPEKIREAEKKIQEHLENNSEIEISDQGVAWLMNNEPEFGRACNQELDEFRKYFRSKLEDYLKNKK